MNDHLNVVNPRYDAVVTRRRLIGGAIALAGGLAVSAPAGAAVTAGGPSRLRLTLPRPTGPCDIGAVSLHLVDHARQDPYLTAPHPRELMVTVWYPARAAGRTRVVPWMPRAALAYYRQELEAVLGSPPQPPDPPPPPATTSDVSLDGVDFPVTHAAAGAPVDRSTRRYPVVFFSPGATQNREQGTTLVEELASHGYVVVTISHTYQAAEVEFPHGRVERGRPESPPHTMLSVRIADTRFVIDSLAALDAGRNPDAGHRPLPGGLRRCMDLTRIGMFGHSLGGATTAQIMAKDARVRAGVNLDGSFFPDDIDPLQAGPEEVDKALILLANRIGARPFMIMASGGFGPDYFGNLTSTVWHHLRGWRRFVSLVGTTHGSYTDDEPLLSQLAAAGTIPTADPWIGTIDPDRAVAAQRAYLRAFFDLSLRNRGSHLLDGPSALYPEARFYPPEQQS